jgi:hypothetical protein
MDNHYCVGGTEAHVVSCARCIAMVEQELAPNHDYVPCRHPRLTRPDEDGYRQCLECGEEGRSCTWEEEA